MLVVAIGLVTLALLLGCFQKPSATPSKSTEPLPPIVTLSPVVSPAPEPKPTPLPTPPVLKPVTPVMTGSPGIVETVKKPQIKSVKPVIKANQSVDEIRYSNPKEMHVGVPVMFTVDIGDKNTIETLSQTSKDGYTVQTIQKATYYLIGLESEFSNQFLIEPSPGQDQKQHRAKYGNAAHWQYRVTPLHRGTYKLLYTLRVYGENDSAGTVVQIQPVTVKVDWVWFKSYSFTAQRIIRDYIGWAALLSALGVVVGGIWKWLHRRAANERTV